MKYKYRFYYRRFYYRGLFKHDVLAESFDEACSILLSEGSIFNFELIDFDSYELLGVEDE